MQSIRDLSFSISDLKFATCSDDTTIKIWDFVRCQEEHSLSGHGWDVKTIDWHPEKALLVSGSKDNLVKLWDVKTGQDITTFHGHKNTVVSTKWNQNGYWLLTAGRDQVVKVYDIRTMKEMQIFKGHRREITCAIWHPFHEDMFTSGGYDGSILHWLVGHDQQQAEMTSAHESQVNALSWHPLGHVLCSGSQDFTTKFWCRNRIGDNLAEKDNTGTYAVGGEAAGVPGGGRNISKQFNGPSSASV